MVTAEKHLDKMTADLKRLQERSEMRAQAWQAASAALSACETWLRDGRPHGTVLEDYDGPEPKLLKGENGLLDAIENRRRRVRELSSDLNGSRAHRTRRATPSSRCARKSRHWRCKVRHLCRALSSLTGRWSSRPSA